MPFLATIITILALIVSIYCLRVYLKVKSKKETNISENKKSESRIKI